MEKHKRIVSLHERRFPARIHADGWPSRVRHVRCDAVDRTHFAEFTVVSSPIRIRHSRMLLGGIYARVIEPVTKARFLLRIAMDARQELSGMTIGLSSSFPHASSGNPC